MPSSNDPSPDAQLIGGGRRAVAALWGAALLPQLLLMLWVPFARGAGFYDAVPIPAVVILATLAGAALGGARRGLAARLPQSLDDWLDPSRRALAVSWLLGGLVALALLGRSAVFLGDFRYAGASLLPGDAFVLRHSCLTAYVHGAILSNIPSANVYDTVYVNADLHAPLPATASRFAPFMLDAFGYPPPFLLLPRALLRLTGDFVVHRALVGAGSIALTFFACAVTARTLGGLAERRMWLLTPLALANPLVILTAQIGNFHLATAALCLLCWAALERRQDRYAGALLAVATLSKIYPGVLGVVLLTQRRWRAVAATFAVAAAIVALSVLVLGVQVWRDFLLYHLPKVQSGEALSFLASNVREIEGNLAPFGIAFKLKALGFAGWSWPQARAFGNAYTALLFVLAALAGLRQGTARRRAAPWFAMTMLASLRSPYAAAFVMSSGQLLCLLLLGEVRSRRSLAALALGWSLVSLPTPSSNADVKMAVSLARVVAIIAVLGWVALRKPSAEPSTE